MTQEHREVYNGVTWSLDRYHKFVAEIPDPDGDDEPELKAFDTYDAMTAFLDREVAVNAKRVTVSLKTLVLENDAPPTPFLINGVNRSTAKLSGKGSPSRYGGTVVPDVPSMRELSALRVEAYGRLKALDAMVSRFSIKLTRVVPGRKSYHSRIDAEDYAAVIAALEAEYEAKRRDAAEFHPGYELSAAIGGPRVEDVPL